MAPLTRAEKAWLQLALVSALQAARWTWWDHNRPGQWVSGALALFALYALALNLRDRLRERRRGP